MKLSQDLEQFLTTRAALIWHCLFATLFFTPFFFRGEILVGSKDVLDVNYPMLLEARRQFHEGRLDLWNPYLLAGMPSALSAIMPIFYPENWLLFFLPESFLFLGVTFLAWLKLGLVGWVAFLLFREEIGEPRWAFLAAVAYQFSGYASWAITTEALSLLLFFTVALYLVWSAEHRSSRSNFLLLSLSLVGVNAASNLMYEAYASLGVLILTLCFRPRQRRLLLCSFTVAILIVSVRWLPSAWELMRSTRVDHGVAIGLDSGMLLVTRLFNPEIFGVSYWSSANILKSISPSLGAARAHVHSHMPHYFGVFPVLLVAWAVFNLGHEKRARGWLLYSAVILALVLSIEPLSFFAHFTLEPFFHRQSLHGLLPVGICMLVAHAGKAWERSEGSLRGVRVVVGGTMLLMGAVWLALLQHRIAPGFLTKLVTLGVVTLVMVSRSLNRKGFGVKALAIACLVLLVIVTWQLSPTPSFPDRHLILLGISVIALSTILLRPHAGPAVLAMLGMTIAWPMMGHVAPLPPLSVSLLLSVAGLARFSLVACLFLSGEGRARGYAILLLAVLFDVIPAFKIHADVVVSPFSVHTDLYRATVPTGWDLGAYRVGSPNHLLAPEWYREIYGERETLSSVSLAFRARSYGGYVNGVPESYARYLRAMIPSSEIKGVMPTYNGLIASVRDERFLDLLGVRYVPGTRRERAGALSRFMLFKSFEIIPDENKLLARLRDPEFDPLRLVLLSQSSPWLEKSQGDSRPLGVRTRGEDDLSLRVETEVAGIVLFNDSFHSGWNAYLNGEPVPILRANGNFMAVVVPPGQHDVRLQFTSLPFRIGTLASLIGILIWMIGSLPLGEKLRRIRIMQPAYQ